MHPHVVLITSPLVGIASWQPTAERLRELDVRVELPDVLSTCDGPPPWREWSTHLKGLIRPDLKPLLVGHSAAGLLAAELAEQIPCRGYAIVDGVIPPAQGPVGPAEGGFLDFIRSLADDCGRLPCWLDWWQTERLAAWTGVEQLAREPQRLEALRADCPRLPVAWFEDAIELSDRRRSPVAYIQTSPFHEQSAVEAERLGWPTQRLQGTHLHPLLEPAETASAILSAWDELGG